MRCRMCRMAWFLVLKVAYGQHFSTFSVLANQNTKRPSFCQLESWTACQTKISPSQTKISPSQVPNSGRKVPNSGRKVPNSGRKVPGCGKKVPRLGISVGQCYCSCFFKKCCCSCFFKMLLQLFFLKCCCSWFNCCFCWRSRRFAMLHFAWFLSMKRTKMGLSEHHPTHPTLHPTLRKPMIDSTLSISVGNVGN